LQVPARDQRTAFAEGAGYDVLELQRSLGRFDPATFRKFQQGHCHDPVALRVVSLHKLVVGDKALTPPLRGKAKAELESHAAGKGGSPQGAAKDRKPTLPRKDGQVDQALYETFPTPKSLRRRLWDAIAALQRASPANRLPQTQAGLGRRFRKGRLLHKASSSCHGPDARPTGWELDRGRVTGLWIAHW
jgi:hypothetical protein